MSAQVLGNGDTSKLMDVYEYKRLSHVHIHNLTNEADLKAQGFGRSELCCHGCGESVLLLFDENKERALQARDQFADRHRRCKAPRHDKCPNYRSKFLTQDIRLPHHPVQKDLRPYHG